MAEYFRDDTGADTLLFIDNIFRFTQAGSEVSALLGRMPSAVGYQPTLATEMGELQERITSTKKGAITSVQAIYVLIKSRPTTQPIQRLRPMRSRIWTPSAFLSGAATSRPRGFIRRWTRWRAVARRLSAEIVGEEHYQVVRTRFRRCCSAIATCRTSSRFLALTN